MTPSRSLLVGATVLAILLATTAPAMAADLPVNLSLHPVGMAGAFFELRMRPGESRSLAVEIGNHGTAAINVWTSTADVYTIINGGFGARLRGEPSSAATTWLTYPTDVFALAAGSSTVRPLAVTVPAGTAPGQYISSLVVENDVPITGSGTLRLDQIIRLAMTVRITIPGPLQPSISIGSASHKVVLGRSVVSVAVANIGNQQLQPDVSFVLLDATRRVVSQTSFQMGAFYARTDTSVELPLATLLAPGRYTVQLVLADADTSARASNDAIPLVIAASVVPTPTRDDPSAGPQGIDVGTNGGTGGLLILIAGIAGGLGIAVALGLAVVVLGRRRRRT